MFPEILDFEQCEWCEDVADCSRCELLNGQYALLCASCEDDLNQQIEDSWLPEEDDHCAVSQPGQPSQRSPREV